MKRFLREMWELWYWVMFCPSKLQQRMNEWSPVPSQEGKKIDTHYKDILLSQISWRFLSQYLGIAIIFCIPLTIQLQHSLDLILILAGLITAYSLGLLSFSTLGLHSPLFLGMTYPFLQRDDLWSDIATALYPLFSLLIFQNLLGVCVGILGISITNQIVSLVLAHKDIPLKPWNLLVFGNTISIGLSCWLILQDITYTLFLTGIASLFLILSLNSLSKQDSAFDLAFEVSWRLLVFVAFGEIIILGTIGSGNDPRSLVIDLYNLYRYSNGNGMKVLVGIILLSCNVCAGAMCIVYRINWLTTLVIISLTFSIGFAVTHAVINIVDFPTSPDTLFISSALVISVIGVYVGVAGKLFGEGIGGIIGLVVGKTAYWIIRRPLVWVIGKTIGKVNALVGTCAGIGLAIGGIIGAVILASSLAVSLAGIGLLPVLLYSMTGLLAGISFALKESKWWLVVLLIIWVLLGGDFHSWQTLWIIPAICIGYFRFLPDYLIDTFLSYYAALPVFSSPTSLEHLHWLPPYRTEVLHLLPIPNHDRILAESFRTCPTETFPILQRMQTQSLPGLPITVRLALPQIVADQLAAIQTTADLIRIPTSDHPFLPILIPHFYRSDTELEISESFLEDNNIQPQENVAMFNLVPEISMLLKSGMNLFIKISERLGFSQFCIQYFSNAEITTLLPRFQAIAIDVNAALQSGSVVLQQRGLERILNQQIKPFLDQLPGLGLRPSAIKRWQPVIQRWQHILELELEQQKTAFQGELLNPFTYGNPLRCNQADVFKGRQSFADEIIRLVLDRNRPTLVLHGPRRCGKSSFLLNLPRLLPSDIIPVYLDMQSSSVNNSDADFCYSLARAIHRDSRGQGVKLPALPERQAFYANPYPFLDDWLDDALPTLENRRLLLNLDEFEKIGSAITAGRMTIRILDQLRSLIQHSDQLGFLFSGVQTLDELGPNWSSYFISVVPMKMLYLNPHEAEDLLTNPDPDFDLRYEPGIINTILRYTRCQPYLLQLLGWCLVKLANEQQTRTVSTSLLEAALPEAFNNGEPYFTNVWTEFTGTNPQEIQVGQALLLKIAKGQLKHIPDHPLIQSAFRRLTRFHVLEQTANSYQFEILMVREWVAERAIVTNPSPEA